VGTLPNSPKLRGLARNPALPPHLLDVLVANADQKLIPLIQYRKDLSAEQLNILAARAAGLPVALVELLDRILVEPEPSVPVERYEEDEEPRHPNVPPETLIKLLEDSNRQVVEAAAANPGLPVSVMVELLKSGWA
jgi:hypothetical protein